MDNQAHQVKGENQESLVPLAQLDHRDPVERLAVLEAKEALVREDSLELQGLLDQLDLLAHGVNQDQMDNLDQEGREVQMDHQGNQEPGESQVQMEDQVHRELEVNQDQQDPLDLLVLWALKDLLDHLVQEEKLDQEENGVLMEIQVK